MNIYSSLQQPSINEFQRIFGLLKHYYGRYNYHSARLSLQSFENLPQFTDSKSIKSNLYRITILQMERTEWSDLQPTAGGVVTDYRFTDVQLKENIMRMMTGHADLKSMLIAFRMEQAQLTYDALCQRLIAFATEFMQPEEDQTLYKQLISASTHQPTSVKDVTSPATVDRIDSNLNAMISDAQPSQSRRCHNCGAFDHNVTQCPYRILCPLCNQLGHIAENCDLYLAPSNSVLGK